MSVKLKDLRAETAPRVEDHLGKLVWPEPEEPPALTEAIRYALFNGGKRLRPLLTLAAARTFGGKMDACLDLACVVEMIHASSLILDDLPCMDDSPLRRGKPALHKAFGEDVALLAAYALLSGAFQATARAAAGLPQERYPAEAYIGTLARAVGTAGLVGGQYLDLHPPGVTDFAALEYIHSHKTGALFIAAARLGGMAAQAREAELEAVTLYAKNLGLAFQITDDLLDLRGTPETLGKPVGRDKGKVTFLSLMGEAASRAAVEELVETALASLAPLKSRKGLLEEFARHVGGRRA
jgi:geranylgeranyl diphosphate synthase, type II